MHRTAGMLTIADGHLVEGVKQVGYILSEVMRYRDPAIHSPNTHLSTAEAGLKFLPTATDLDEALGT